MSYVMIPNALRSLQRGTGLAGASTLLLLALPGTPGCASSDAARADDLAPIQALRSASSDAGSARFEVAYQYELGRIQYDLALRESTTDEFVRVGEELRFTIPALVVWE